MSLKDLITAERFYSKVDARGPTECWEWKARKGINGYGQFDLDGKTLRAHRVAWELTHGPIPAGDGFHGTCVLHHCDNRACVNPWPGHLFLGTHADNMADMYSKQRRKAALGEANGRAKLTESDIISIRADPRTLQTIGAAFGVHLSQVWKIKRGKRWAHV